jgi:hypothetical protein
MVHKNLTRLWKSHYPLLLEVKSKAFNNAELQEVVNVT